jgi:hypothetical protein
LRAAEETLTTPAPLTEDVPRIYPRRLPDPTRRALLRRSRTIAKVVAVHFTPTVLRQVRTIRQGALPAAQLARPLRKSFQDLGGTFMKFGQIIASSPGMFGDEVADEFRACLDSGPPVPFADIRQRVEEDLGLSLSDAFTDFETEPIGTASIAVVHRARLLDGRVVAVKVLRPDVEHIVATDLDLMQPLLEILVRQTGDQMAGNVLQVLDGFRVQIGEEMDLRNEARSMVHFRRLQNEFDLKLMAVPEPYVDLSGRNVLTMEFFDGVPIDDLAKVAELGHDPTPLVQEVMRAFFLTTVRWGAFHGDVHAGNMMLLRDGRIGVIDWGIVGRLDPSTHRFFISLLSAAMGNEAAWPVVTGHITDVYGPAIGEAVGLSGDDLTAFFRSILEPALNRPGRDHADHPAADGQGPGRRGPPAQRPGDSATAPDPTTGAAYGRPVGRLDVGLRPGHILVGQAADVLRAVRPHVRVGGTDPQRPGLHYAAAGRGRPRGRRRGGVGGISRWAGLGTWGTWHRTGICSSFQLGARRVL